VILNLNPVNRRIYCDANTNPNPIPNLHIIDLPIADHTVQQAKK